jgi:probable phosphoglycerate mutase
VAALPGTTGRRRVYLMRHGHVDYFDPKVREIGIN